MTYDRKRWKATPLSAFLFLFLFVGLAFAPSCHAEPLVVASPESMPFFFQGAEGDHRGILVDFWQLWSQKSDIPVRFRSVTDIDLTAEIQAGRVDIAGGKAYTLESGNELYFSRPFYEITCYIFHRSSVDSPQGMDDLAGLRVGVVAGSFFYHFVSREQPDATIVEYQETIELVEDAVEGKIDAFILENPVAMVYLARLDGFSSIRKSIKPVTTIHFHAAVGSGRRELLSQVNNGLAEIDQEEMSAIVRTWTGEIKPSSTSQPLKKIVVATSVGTAPFEFVDDDEKPVGMFVDFWSLWSKKTGIEVEFKTASWNQTLTMVREGEADAHAGLFYSTTRDSYLDFAAPLYESTTHFFYHRSIHGLESIEDLLGFNIGIIEGDYALEYVRQNLPAATLAVFPDNESLFKAVKDGQVRVFIKDTPIGLYHLDTIHMRDQFKYNSGAPLYSKTFYAAVREGNNSLSSIISTGMAAITTEERAAAVRTWMGVSDQKSDDVLAIAISDGYMPFTGLNFRGEPTGMFVDIWRLWSEKTGRQIEFLPTSWDQTINGLRNGNIDIHSGLFRSDERSAWIDFSQPFYRVPSTFIYNPVFFQPEGIEDLSDRKLGVIKGAYQEQYLFDRFPSAEVVPLIDSESMIRAALEGEIHAFIDETPVIQNYLAQIGESGSFRRLGSVQLSERVHAGVKKGNTQTLAIIDAGFNAIANQELAEIEERWISDPDLRRYGGPFREIRLTESQESWLLRHQKLNLGVGPQWVPFDYIGKDGEHLGIASGYVKKIEERLGVSMDPVTVLSRAEVIARAKTGQIDAISAIARTRELENVLLFTKPYLTFPLVVVTKDDAPFVRDLSGLKGLKVAMSEEYVPKDILEGHAEEFEVVPFTTIEEGLVAVSRERADALVGNLPSVGSAIKKMGLVNLKIAATTEYSLDLSFGIRKDLPILVEIIDKAIASISEQEKSRLNDEWLALRYELEFNWRRALTWIFVIGAAVSILIFFIIRWNRRLTREITDRKKIETELKIAKSFAEATNEAKSDFLANMSHEIRTPMNAVIGLTHLALQSDPDLKMADYLVKIQDSGRSLLGIINDILDFSKISAGKLEMERIDFDLEDVFSNLSSMIDQNTQESGLELVFSISGDVPLKLIGDPLRLGQILLNLSNNAIKFTEQGEIVVSTELVEITSETVSLRFSVKDTGIGMADEEKTRLFRSFSQADTSTTRKYGGTGLGLSISKQLVEMMGGEIAVDSAPAEGSTFYFTAFFELQAPDPLAQSICEDAYSGSSVLIIDDNESSRLAIRKILERCGVRVDVAGSGSDAIEMFLKMHHKEIPYHLVLLDNRMPEMDGFETIEQLRNSPGGYDTPTVMMGAMSEREVMGDRLEEAGFVGFLCKPVRPSQLHSIALSILGSDDKPEDASSTFEREAPKSWGLSGLRVLLTEDNSINRQVGKEILEAAGVTVAVAVNGKEAVAMVETGDYDCVLMDIQMPEMDGYEATRTLRARPSLAGLPIVAMTANAMSGDRERCFAAGMNDYISKPIDPDELYRALAKWSGRSGARTEGERRHSAKNEPFLQLGDIDIDAGLKRLAGNEKTYMTLLRQFRREFIGLDEKIASAVDEGDYSDAVRFTHTIKGTAANLGAVELASAAEMLEIRLREEGESLPEPEYSDFSEKLKVVIESITQFKVNDPKEVETRTERLTLDESRKLRAGLNAIFPLLDASDTLATERLEELLKRFEGKDVGAKLVDAHRLTQTWDFEQAATVLRHFSDQLDSEHGNDR